MVADGPKVPGKARLALFRAILRDVLDRSVLDVADDGHVAASVRKCPLVGAHELDRPTSLSQLPTLDGPLHHASGLVAGNAQHPAGRGCVLTGFQHRHDVRLKQDRQATSGFRPRHNHLLHRPKIVSRSAGPMPYRSTTWNHLGTA